MLSSAARFFVSEYIESAEMLDVLMLMHREPDRKWTATEVSEAVFTVPASATQRLAGLAFRGLVITTDDAPPRYVLSIPDDELRTTIRELDTAYRKNRAGVIGLVFENNADPLQSFTNAFRMRKDQ